MKAEELQFQQAINAAPDDVPLQLVFADWLDEQQDPRGELLRLMHDSAYFDEARLQQLLAVVAPVVPCCENSLGMQLVYIPAGQFRMGSPVAEKDRWDAEGPQHQVTLTQGFYLGKYAVTQAEYEKVMGTNPSYFKGAKLPVESVSWEEAKEFCEKLSAQEGKAYRLPTEAEWEYACRAGTTTPFHTGARLTTAQANYNGNYPYADGAKVTYRKKTLPVGSFAPNAFGLHDMHGNVWEWCEDWFKDDEYKRGDCKDPTGPANGSDRVHRGGSWFTLPAGCRSARRGGLGPVSGYGFLGFRLAAVASSGK